MAVPSFQMVKTFSQTHNESNDTNPNIDNNHKKGRKIKKSQLNNNPYKN